MDQSTPAAHPERALHEFGPSMVEGLGQHSLLAGLIEQIDYGVLLLWPDGRLVLANAIGQGRIDGSGTLIVRNSKVDASTAAEHKRWARALADTAIGIRSLVLLDSNRKPEAWAVCPLEAPWQGRLSGFALAISSRPRGCEPLSVQNFGRQTNLTTMETRVLELLLQGRSAAQIASELSVKVSTTRSHIKALLGKTGSASLRNLLLQVSCLPPVRPLRVS